MLSTQSNQIQGHLYESYTNPFFATIGIQNDSIHPRMELEPKKTSTAISSRPRWSQSQKAFSPVH